MIHISNPYSGSQYKINCPFCSLELGIGYTYFNELIGESRADNTYEASSPAIALGRQNLMSRNFKMVYPFIQNTEKDPAKGRINDAITGEVAELFKTQVLIPDKADFQDINGAYTVMLNQAGILSILLELYTYVNRAAHGYTACSSITADTATGAVYSFKDLFSGDINYIFYLSELAKQYIKDNDIQLINEYNGITADQKFFLTPHSLILYYPLYEYTPYVYGLLKIPIRYSKIVQLLSPTSPIKRLLNQ